MLYRTKKKSRRQKLRVWRGFKTAFKVNENGFMKFATDVCKILKEQGAMRQSWTKLNVDIKCFL